jgi:hypothetical protein
MKSDARIEAIERASWAQVERNVATLAKYVRGGLKAAAHSIVAAPNPSVAVLTGAYVPWATPPAAETDGPPGAALLASGLLELGIAARLMTDHWCQPVVEAAGRAVGIEQPIDVCGGDPVDVERIEAEYKRLGVTHIVAVERLGPAVDGRVRNFRGEDVTPFTAAIEPLFASGQQWTTIGIGDGGNEIGMGNVPSQAVEEAIEYGRRIHCTIGCDHLIVAGVSNWGALGLLLAVEILCKKTNDTARSLATPASHRRIVEACVAAGAVDGTEGCPTASVDGLDLREHDIVIERMCAAGRLELSK